jgi:hypothetical protein
MYRSLTALLVASAFAPLAAFASEPGSSGHATTGHTTSAASGKGSPGNLGNKKFEGDYKNKYGTKFDKGYFYSGREHYHWSHCCWNPSYGCYTYWCPSARCYYYWCQPRNCFYPTSYCPCGVYTWPSCYVVPNITIVAYQPVVVAPPVVQTVVVQPAVITYQPPVVRTTVTQQTVVTRQSVVQPAVSQPVIAPQQGIAPSGPGQVTPSSR